MKTQKKTVIFLAALLLLTITFTMPNRTVLSESLPKSPSQADHKTTSTDESIITEDLPRGEDPFSYDESDLSKCLDYSASILLYSEDHDTCVKNIRKIIEKTGAKIGKEDYYQSGFLDGYKCQIFDISISCDDYSDFIEEIEAQGTLTSKQITSENYFDQYTKYNDTLYIYEKEYSTYEDLLSKTTNVDEVASIKEAMMETKNEMAQIKNEMATIDRNTKYYRICLTIENQIDQPEYKEVKKNVFQRSLESFGTVLAFLFPYALIIAGIILVFIYKKTKKWHLKMKKITTEKEKKL